MPLHVVIVHLNKLQSPDKGRKNVIILLCVVFEDNCTVHVEMEVAGHLDTFLVKVEFCDFSFHNSLFLMRVMLKTRGLSIYHIIGKAGHPL